MNTPRKNRILISILLLISMMMSGGVRSAQAAPTFNESPVILTGMGISFNGSPVRKIDWTSYDGYAMTAGTATNAGNSNTTDNVHLGTQTAGKWCTTDGTTINCTSNSPLMSYTETDPTIALWAKAALKPSYTFNEIGSGSIGATTGYFSGNVGIGKTNPGFALDVNGVVNASALYVGGSAYIGSQWTTTSTSIYYNTGNVGIGTTAPTGQLSFGNSVAQAAVLTYTANGAVAGQNILNGYYSPTAANPYTRYFDIVAVGQPNGTAGDSAIRFLTNPLTNNSPAVERVRITGNGNVGIGTTAPATLLDVNGTLTTRGNPSWNFNDPGSVSVGAMRMNLNDGTSKWALGLRGTAGTLTNDIYFTSYASGAWTDRMVIQSGGNVGIGLTNPGVKLDVSGALRATSATITAVQNGIVMADGSGNLYATSTAVATGIPIGTSGQTLRSNGTNWLANSTLYNDGTNVGVGTTAPGAKLDIANTSLSKSLNINMTGIDSPVVDTTFGIYVLNDRGAAINNSSRYGGYFEVKGQGSNNNYNYGLVGLANKQGRYGYIGTGVLGVGRHTFASYNDTYANLIGVQGQIDFTNDNIAIADSGYGASLYTDATIPANKTLATYYGLYMAQPTVTGAITNRYAIYQADSYAKNYFASNVGIGTTNPAANLDIKPVAGSGLHVQESDGGAVAIDLWANTTKGVIDLKSSGTTQISLDPAGSSYLNGGNIGVGLTNPGVKLDVSGALRATSATISTVQNGIVMADGSGNLYATSTTVATGLPSPVGITGQTLRSNGTSWLANSAIFNDGANVGIGTTTPGAKLSVYGDGGSGIGTIQIDQPTTPNGSSTVGPHIFIKSAGVARGWIGFFDSVAHGSGTQMNIRGYAGLRLSGASSGDHLYINTSGNIGIGTTNPSAILQIKGTAGDLFKITNSAGVDAFVIDNGNLNAKFYPQGNWTQLSISATNDTDTGIGWGNANGVGFITGGSATLVATNGNVGIGTTNPGRKFEVNGQIYSSVAASDTVNSGGNFMGSGGYWSLRTGVNNRMGLDVYNGGATLEALTVLQGGNVGINNTAPGVKLDVSGALRATSATITTVQNGIVMADGSGNLYATSTSIATGLPSPVGITGQTLRSNGTSWIANNLLYNSGTSIGIGTTSPTGVFDVVGGAGGWVQFTRNNKLLYLNANYSDTNIFGQVAMRAVDEMALSLSSDDSHPEYLYMLHGGNIGIGTTNPQSALSLAGTSAITIATADGSDNSYMLISGGGATAAGRGAGIVLSGNDRTTYGGQLDLISGDSANGRISFQPAGVEQVRITNAGNVGIGTSNPISLLQVGLDAGGELMTGASSRATILGIGLSSATEQSLLRLVRPTHGGVAWPGVIDFKISRWEVAYPYPRTQLNIGLKSSGSSDVNDTVNIMSLRDNGNVGIGKTNPAVILDVNGAINAGGTVSGTGLCIGTDCNVGWLWKGAQNGNIYNGTTGAGNVGIGITNPTAKLHVVGGMILNRTAVADANYTALGTDYIIAFTSLSVQRTLTLPNALCTSGRVFLIVNETNTGFSVNVDPEGATLIVGQTNVLLPAYNSTPVYCSGSNWYMY